jgi:hypothetical protein
MHSKCRYFRDPEHLHGLINGFKLEPEPKQILHYSFPSEFVPLINSASLFASKLISYILNVILPNRNISSFFKGYLPNDLTDIQFFLILKGNLVYEIAVEFPSYYYVPAIKMLLRDIKSNTSLYKYLRVHILSWWIIGKF